MTEKIKYEYYTPKPEELKIGLEVEVGLMDGHLKWKPTIIRKEDIIGNKPIPIEQYNSYILVQSPLRIRYLVEQDFINEGWRFREVGRSKFFKLNNNSEFALNYNTSTNMLFIEKADKEPGDIIYHYPWEGTAYIFVGRCRCINEFRTIIKFLEI